MYCIVQSVERDQQESVNDEAKAKEKLANKRSLLLKKVLLIVALLKQLMFNYCYSLLERGNYAKDQRPGVTAFWYF